jgi:tetratricopeptide (TPR) repeat protein
LLAAGFSFAHQARGQGNDPQKIFQQAVEAQQRGDFQSAIRDYEQFLQLSPNSFEAEVNLGAAYTHEEKFDAAIRTYRAALSQQPENQGVLLDLGLAYYKKGDLANAREEFTAVLRLQPQNLQAAILLGDSDNRLGKPEETVRALSPLEAENSANADFEYVLGAGLIASGARLEGVSRIEKIAEKTKSADEFLLAGQTLVDLNDFSRARRDLEKALSLNPNLPGVYSLTGQAFDQTGDLKGAEDLFRKALEVNPDDFIANLYLGAMLSHRRELEDARKYLAHAVELKSDSAMAQYELGMLESLSGNYEAAARHLEISAQLDPKWMEPHVQLATLFYRLHRPEDGEKQRQIVQQMAAAAQAKGPPIPQ